MSIKKWLERRTPDELLSHYALLRHLPQIDFKGYSFRKEVKNELERRAICLRELMENLDEPE